MNFQLTDKFLEQYIGKEPQWGPVGYVTYKRTYARDLISLYPRHMHLGHNAGLDKTEEFWLTVTRVVEGTFDIIKRHCLNSRLPFDEKLAQAQAQHMYELIWDFKFTPPGRGLWTMGTPIVELIGGAALNNCAFVSTKDIDKDFAEPFCFLMDMSMLGVGVGGDTKGADKFKVGRPKVNRSSFMIHDNREGWVAAVKVILDAFQGKGALPSSFDTRYVRKRGAPLKTFGGKAAGKEAIETLVNELIDHLDSRAGKNISSADIVDIFNLIGKCAVAGGTRRSAEIMFGERTDETFMELKDPVQNAEKLRSHRWCSNNSIYARVGQSYYRVAKQIAKNGEPGLLWLDNARSFGRMGRQPDYRDSQASGANPCLEQTLEPYELCCLVETYPAHHKNAREYADTIRSAYLYGKAVTLVPTHNQKTNAVLLRNRRIGLSMSGIAQAIHKFGRRYFFNMCESTYAKIEALDKEYSSWLCVPESIKKTSVKPSGTVSLLCGATPGIHYPHSEYYWRVIRFDNNSSLMQELKSAGYKCVDIENEPNTTAVYFPVQEKHFSRSERDISMWEQLEMAAALQQHWADNQVSVTVKFSKQEAKDIEGALEYYETRLKGVSFLPQEDHGYEHAPYQSMTEAEYHEANSKILPVNLSADVTPERFCDGDKCEI